METYRTEPLGAPARLLALVGLVLAALGGKAEAITRYVANNGLDSMSCGTFTSPCRSISRAISNADAGDRIVVGPGKYGDLNEDGLFTLPGEEEAEVGVGCNCMIKVDKTLTILPRTWAGETVLDARGASVSVVQIAASGVVFGMVRNGFALFGGRVGLQTNPDTTKVRAGGNLAITNTLDGFLFDGTAHLLQGNVAIDNGGNGFFLLGSGHVVTGSLSVRNSNHGLVLGGSLHRASGNTASANGSSGFVLIGSGHLITGNVANANGSGFQLSTSEHVLTGNMAHGNRFGGIDIYEAGADLPTISGNNLAGNDPATNCGLRNYSGSAVVARSNFWGTAAGPGVDPGDRACTFLTGSSTIVTPFATKESRIVVPTPF